MKNAKVDTKLLGVGLILLSSISAGFVGGYYGAKSNGGNTKIQVNRQAIDNESNLITSLAKDVGPSVVSINITSQSPQQTLFGVRNVEQQSAGTGVIIDADKGIIITNRHVVGDTPSDISVTLSDGTELKGIELIGKTSSSDTLDVAFLKIKDKKGKDIKAAKIGDSSAVQVGDRVIAIGNALGQFQNSVTSGIISGYGRSIQAGDESGSSSESLQNLFQTDASINQGNSGGPLINTKGEVVGINTAVAGSAENIGFAIPVNDTKGLISSVLKEGKLLRPYIGVRYVSLTDDYAYQFNIKVKRGAYLAPRSSGSVVVKDSPAEKSGLKEKDIITKVDGVSIDEKNSLVSLIGKKSVGENVKLTIVRDDKEQTIDIKLEAVPAQ